MDKQMKKWIHELKLVNWLIQLTFRYQKRNPQLYPAASAKSCGWIKISWKRTRTRIGFRSAGCVVSATGRSPFLWSFRRRMRGCSPPRFERSAAARSFRLISSLFRIRHFRFGFSNYNFRFHFRVHHFRFYFQVHHFRFYFPMCHFRFSAHGGG